MTDKGVGELYMWLTTAWPLVIKPGASNEWKVTKLRDMKRVYAEYQDEDVMAAFQKWTDENDKFPTTKNILNELKWMRMKRLKQQENEELWPMDFMEKDGTEWSYGLFRRSEFVNHPRNPEHLEPEEWERRFVLTRRRIMDKIWKELKEEERKNATNRRG